VHFFENDRRDAEAQRRRRKIHSGSERNNCKRASLCASAVSVPYTFFENDRRGAETQRREQKNAEFFVNE
jgi:hypothetical protein